MKKSQYPCNIALIIMNNMINDINIYIYIFKGYKLFISIASVLE